MEAGLATDHWEIGRCVATKTYGDRWRIVRRIGEGGQAHTYEVLDLRDGSTGWVLKRLKNRRRLSRFEREILALDALRSPHTREVHLEDRLFHIAGHSPVALKELSYELALAVARHLQALDVASRSQQVALVVAAALSSLGGGQLPVAGFEVLAHLLLEDLLEDGLHALANPGLHVQLPIIAYPLTRS